MGSHDDSGSLSFDRAADIYDRTRWLPPEATETLFALLRAELAGRELCLDIGVGTGRIALPLIRSGIDVVGIDLSRKMLARLVDNAGGRILLPLAQANATRLPFRDDSFDAAIGAWVLHLIRAWREVVAEVVRVVRPGGLFVIDLGGTGRGIEEQIKNRFRDEAAVDWPRGPRSYEELDELMRSQGATVRPLEPIRARRKVALESEIDALETGVFSVSWLPDERTRKRAADATRAWAEERFGPLDVERDVEAIFEWRAYDLR